MMSDSDIITVTSATFPPLNLQSHESIRQHLLRSGMTVSDFVREVEDRTGTAKYARRTLRHEEKARRIKLTGENQC
jgi:hypothetical protein